MKEEILKMLQDVRPEFDYANSNDYISEGLLDSFDIICLLSKLEEQYDVKIDGLDIVPENFSTIDAIVDLVNKSKDNK